VNSGSAILTLDNIQYSGGIIGVSTAGNVDITTFGEVIATGDYGVYGESWDGNVQILVGGDVGGGNIPPLYGVAGFSKGDVKIDLAEDVTLTASLGGIVGYSDDAGDVNITLGDGVTVIAGDSGVAATNEVSGSTTITIGEN